MHNDSKSRDGLHRLERVAGLIAPAVTMGIISAATILMLRLINLLHWNFDLALTTLSSMNLPSALASTGSLVFCIAATTSYATWVFYAPAGDDFPRGIYIVGVSLTLLSFLFPWIVTLNFLAILIGRIILSAMVKRGATLAKSLERALLAAAKQGWITVFTMVGLMLVPYGLLPHGTIVTSSESHQGYVVLNGQQVTVIEDKLDEVTIIPITSAVHIKFDVHPSKTVSIIYWLRNSLIK